MDQDIKAIKPYISHLKKQLALLKPQIDKLTKIKLDERLISTGSEMERLKLINTYLYVLNSLLFALAKLTGVKDVSMIMQELNRVKEHIDEEKAIESKLLNIRVKEQSTKDKVESEINNILNKPSISTKNFEKKNTHIKFENKDTKVSSAAKKITKPKRKNDRKQ
ncbi:hypothetical protein KAFR_0D04790 [Kazachstania africana CBS 2517]|uniref:Exosome complex protein n=1 Tax=Kazachstania africana (strain ATCC 22294 / BCRC 22015 / CBS 2517 / CECT 1963 / NBRC 1671 / NRRL Y-8276) TaxID=1071382 RepID=H2AUS6_KAZAF|nr:hypothetical protein KAFR_0D04790 [Kazachstania africana CBS 2517]CCF58126.1 hypothetical protein KAFR_0D04790 [Kazachstania africana CBS 2517]